MARGVASVRAESTEDRIFERTAGVRRAIHQAERLITALALAVDISGQEPLAGARFADYESGTACLRRCFGDLAGLAHGLAVANHDGRTSVAHAGVLPTGLPRDSPLT